MTTTGGTETLALDILQALTPCDTNAGLYLQWTGWDNRLTLRKSSSVELARFTMPTEMTDAWWQSLLKSLHHFGVRYRTLYPIRKDDWTVRIIRTGDN